MQAVPPSMAHLLPEETTMSLNLNLTPAFSVMGEVIQERHAQDEKWGEQNHEAAFWLAILGEEFGEVCRAVCEDDPDNYREELIQTAAVCVAMVECFDRKHAQ